MVLGLPTLKASFAGLLLPTGVLVRENAHILEIKKLKCCFGYSVQSPFMLLSESCTVASL